MESCEEEIYLAQREAFIQQTRAFRNIPGSDSFGAETDRSRAPSTTSEIQPSFGSLSACQIDFATESALFDLEVGRLFDSLKAPSLPLETGVVIPLPDQVKNHEFACLESLTRALLCSLAIIGVDDITVLHVYESESRANREVIFCAGQRLKESQMDLHALGYSESTLGNYYRDLQNLEPASLGPVNSMSDSQAPAYHALVDYITTTVARLLVSDSKDNSVNSQTTSWRTMTMTVLAKTSAKMKVLGQRLSTFNDLGASSKSSRSSRSRSRSHSWHGFRPRRMSLSTESSDFSEKRSDSSEESLPQLPEESVSRRRISYKSHYLSDMSEISTLVFHIMWRILSDLESRSIKNQSTHDLDISGVVFATGPQTTSAILYQDAGVEVTGSQTDVTLGICRRIFDIIVETTDSMQQGPSSEEDASASLHSGPMRPQMRSKISTSSTQACAPEQTLVMKSMSHLMSIMVLLSCMNPTVADRVFRAYSKVGAPDIIRKLHAEGRNFTATISLRNAIEASPIVCSTDNVQSSPLSQSRFYLKQSRPEWTPDTSNTRTRHQAPCWLQTLHSEAVSYRPLPQTHYREASDITRQWAIEETAITVRCLNYTLSVMVGCGFLVTGGLLAGFLVGERIVGVDPFNLTMFCWIIAGFIILVAKSIRVVDWPWRDFLLGRVTTRSVSELASVTGLDGQFVILHLLSLEGRVPLVTRGPFNSIFTWSGEGDTGFSVDVKPTVRTLVASGMVVLEVLASGGPALVCMDLRPEMNRYNRVDSRKMTNTQNKKVLRLVCVDPPRQDEKDKDVVFERRRTRWERVIGIYNDECRRVR